MTTAPMEVDWLCWASDGWENASEYSVQDPLKVTRAQAQQRFANETCERFIDVRVWKRYVRPYSQQDMWDYWRETYAEDSDAEPETPPEGWVPDFESIPSWEFVHRSHPQARAVWICGFKADTPPHSPEKPCPTPS